MTPQHFIAKQERFEGWNKYNREHWLADYPDFAEHFVRNIFSEPHSTKQIEDGIDWAGDTSGPVLVKTVEARTIPAAIRRQRGDVSQDPLSGADDPRRPTTRSSPTSARKLVAELTGGELVTIPGGGHNPLGRYPGQVQRPDQRLPRPRLGIAAPEHAPEPAGPAHGPRRRSIFPRRSASGTAAATSPSRASCASCIPTCRSTGWRRTR